KSGPAAKSAAPAKPGKSVASAKSSKSDTASKPAKSAKSVESAAPVDAEEDFEPEKPAKRSFGSRLVGLLARPDPELDIEEDPIQDAREAIKAAKSRAELEAELQREAEEFGLEASNPISLYGPNGEEVAALLDSLTELDDETAEAIADSYELTPDAERKVAQSVIRRRHRGGKLGLELETAERAVSDWFSALGLVEDEDIDLYTLVANAATDAVDALVLVDELADEDFNTLYVPWADVMDPEEDEEDSEEGDEDEAEEEAEAEVSTDSKKSAGKGGKGKKAEPEPEPEEEEDAEEAGEFGPNTALVTELLTNLGTLDSEIIVELIEVWREQPKEDLKLAHRSLQELADESSKWREQMRLAQAEVFAWMEGGATRFNKIRGDVGDWARTREIAGPAVADAVSALIMSDMLDSEDAGVLFDPWSKVVGTPALPLYEDEDEGEGDES
ncbi:MAG TPA: hypothetical protein VF375_00495, partial [Candidatus Limnocylindrales bacterium]